MATGNSFAGRKSVKGSEEDFHIVCLPCHRDGETMAAFGYCCQCKEHLCASCFRIHKRPTPTRHHILLDKDEMPDTQDLDATVQPSPSDNLTTPCPHHKNEKLKLYCHDHKMLLCHICVAIEHTKQCQVAYIPDISDQIINSKEYESIVERMDKVLTKCAKIKDKTSEDAENSNISMNEGRENMRRLKQKIIDKVDKMEKDIEHKIKALKQQNENRQNEEKSICNDVIKSLTLVSDSLNQLNASKQADLLFVELKQSMNHLQEYENRINSLSTNNPIEMYQFVPGSMISDLLQSEETWGDLTAIQQQHETSTSDQQPDQVIDQTQPANSQDQTASSTSQQQQPTGTSNQKDQSKPNSEGKQVSNSSDQQQDQTKDQTKPNSEGKQVSNSSDQKQDQAKDQTKPKSKGTQATSSSDQKQQGQIEAQTTPKRTQYQPVSRPAYDNIQVTRLGEINVKTSEDRGDCCITGMTTLPSGRLVLADQNNNAIKLVDNNTNKIISRLTVGQPRGITATSSTQVAVTVPDEQEIQFITATDKLSLSHKVKTNGKCYGICCHENNIVVTYKNPGKLEIMNMQGMVMTSVQKNSTGEDIFSQPGYVQANRNFIYVSDIGKFQVIMLNWRGEVTGRIGGLDIPEGLTLLHDGSLLVCDCDWDGYTVYHVSGDGTNKRAVLQGVTYHPRAICVDDGGHTLYVSRRYFGFSFEDVWNNILVYKL